jgi:hypothetical protein
LEGVHGSHLVQRLPNGNWADTASRLRDGHQGARNEEVTAPLIKQTVSDELNDVGEAPAAVGIGKQREAVVTSEAGGARGSVSGDVFLPDLLEGFVRENRSVRSVAGEWWDG